MIIATAKTHCISLQGSKSTFMQPFDSESRPFDMAAISQQLTVSVFKASALHTVVALEYGQGR